MIIQASETQAKSFIRSVWSEHATDVSRPFRLDVSSCGTYRSPKLPSIVSADTFPKAKASFDALFEQSKSALSPDVQVIESGAIAPNRRPKSGVNKVRNMIASSLRRKSLTPSQVECHPAARPVGGSICFSSSLLALSITSRCFLRFARQGAWNRCPCQAPLAVPAAMTNQSTMTATPKAVPSTLKNLDGSSLPIKIVLRAYTPRGNVKPHQPMLNGKGRDL